MNRRMMLTAGAAIAAALPLTARAQQTALQPDGSLSPAKAPALLGGTFSKLISQVALEKAQKPVRRT